ncbi:MAG: PilZ domain-containing protein [Desulfobacterales bacterium]
MKKLDRRKFPRIKICNPISYDSVDQSGIQLDQNMGIALDISQNGILLETAQRIQSKYIYLIFVDMENNLIRIAARVIFSVKNKKGNFKSGINFQGSQEENRRFAKKVIQAYQHQKSEQPQINGANV